jgi:hypothetical protein
VCWWGSPEFGEENLNLELGLELELEGRKAGFAPPRWDVRPWSVGEMRTRLEIICR